MDKPIAERHSVRIAINNRLKFFTIKNLANRIVLNIKIIETNKCCGELIKLMKDSDKKKITKLYIRLIAEVSLFSKYMLGRSKYLAHSLNIFT